MPLSKKQKDILFGILITLSIISLVILAILQHFFLK